MQECDSILPAFDEIYFESEVQSITVKGREKLHFHMKNDVDIVSDPHFFIEK